jgi:hypothetical protein
MCKETKYFAFGYNKKAEIDRLLGVVNFVPEQVGNHKTVQDTISLPRQFMMGRKFNGWILESAEGDPAVAYIDVDAWPLAL